MKTENSKINLYKNQIFFNPNNEHKNLLLMSDVSIENVEKRRKCSNPWFIIKKKEHIQPTYKHKPNLKGKIFM